jgi:hypothetical protein
MIVTQARSTLSFNLECQPKKILSLTFATIGYMLTCDPKKLPRSAGFYNRGGRMTG